MSSTLKKFLICTAIGAVCAIVVGWAQGLFAAETTADIFRILSDGFFVTGGMILAYGVLVWTSNGGVWDGLMFSTKMLFGRFRKDFEENKITFAEYRQQREAKASSPKTALLSGAALLIIAALFLILYYT